MNLYLPNIRFGLVALFITGIAGGMVLGGTFNDMSVQNGNHLLGLARFYMREGHSHGNFMAFFNLFVGLMLPHLALSSTAKKVASWSAMAAIMLPVGLALKGFAGAPDDYPPIGIIGILGITVSMVILIIGAFKAKAAKQD